MAFAAGDDADVKSHRMSRWRWVPESTEVNNGPHGPFVVNHEIWDHAAGVSPFLG
jgi:hypothetical protein